MPKTIDINLFSQKSIDNAIKELKKYSDSVEYKTKLLAERLSERGVEIARVQIADLDAIFTGELIQSIHNEYVSSVDSGVVFAVVADSEHAVFVEFGTGIRGKEEPYPYPFPEGVSWQYASGKTIRQLADGRYGWFYPRDGKWYFTQGMASRPFMYLTSIELQKEVVEIAKDVFKS